MQQVIEFKWQSIGFNFHAMGGLFHLFYMCVIIVYINIVYVQDALEDHSLHDDVNGDHSSLQGPVTN